ncbi:hypothetical protein [Nodularia spumigena]|uniref:hypothetical protein n=1 Tax=Nodularia spumigena TaxID=70799 RepID=UPI00232EAA52|nr:hypothetical protein [Nodularia spumigena]
MSIPNKFNSWLHLKNMMRRWHNQRVAEHFKDVPPNNISSKRGSLRHACTIQRTDTADMINLRKMFFEFDCMNAQSLQAPIYGIPVSDLQRDVRFKPQVKLVFRELYPLDEGKFSPVRGELTFRLMDETSQTYTPAKAKALAVAIKKDLFTPLLVWNKGKNYYYYRDDEKGYDFRLLVPNKSEGQKIVTAVLSVQNHSFDDENVNYQVTDKNFPKNPGNQTVYSKSVPKPRRRPTASVRIRHAQLLLDGRLKCINLVSTQESALHSALERVIAK